MSTSLIEKAISIVGSKAELARRLSVTPQFVNKMAKTGVTPASQCRKIETITCGQVKAEDLRPDIFCTPVTTGAAVECSAAQ